MEGNEVSVLHILSAASDNLRNYPHQPVWKYQRNDRRIVSLQLEQCLYTSAPVLCAISHNNHHACPIIFMENPFFCRSSPAKAFTACASRRKQTNATKADGII